MHEINFEERLRKHTADFARVVPFAETDKLLLMDFTAANKELTDDVVNDTTRFIQYINGKLKEAGAKYGIGGYGENRTIYRRSTIFGSSPTTVPAVNLRADVPEKTEAEKATATEVGRTLHLGIDVWGAPYTKVMAPLNGIVHSFAFNNAYGDYGATIVLTHNLGGATFHTLYGHLSLNSLKNLHEGDVVYKGDVFAEFGIPFENGQWPPHLHFQLIKDVQGAKGDYPGVCAASGKEPYLANCPDADSVLGMMRYAARG